MQAAAQQAQFERVHGLDMALQRKRVVHLHAVGKLPRKLARRILTGRLPIKRLPKLEKIHMLTHRKLLDCLRRCPESEYFYFKEIFVHKDNISK